MSVVFFTDRDLGLKFPAILKQGGLQVERHVDHFVHDASDEEWLAGVSAKGWVAVTHDSRIRYKPNELRAVVDHNAALLVVVGAAPLPELARSFVATSARILEFVATHQRPFIAKVYRPSAAAVAEEPDAPGLITLWFPHGRS